jgi:release factor glutamine methyltransferase
VKAEVATVSGYLEAAAKRIAGALQLEKREARLEAQVLASRALNVNRAWLIAHDQDVLTPVQAEAVEFLVARRAQGEPVAYILGEKEFYGRMFKVTQDVLIPRPETELLVEAALENLPKDRPAQVLDLGTGSGCIAVTLALERPDCKVTAVDMSHAALAIAAANANRLGAEIEFLFSDWLSTLHGRKFDLIVSNPPYVEEDYTLLSQSDLAHEPRHALTSGADGMDDISRIVAAASGSLLPGGTLLLEHGWTQGEKVRDLLGRYGFITIRTLSDYAGLPRCSLGSKPDPNRPCTQEPQPETVKPASDPEA